MPYSGRLEYYYGNMREFWRFLDNVYPGNKLYDSTFPELSDITNFLEKHKIAITDLVEETDGTPFSTDDDMKWTKLNSRLMDLLENGSIEVIYFTSFGGKNSALSLFKKWLKLNNYIIRISNHTEWRNSGLHICINNKMIRLELLFSPSPTARRSASKIPEFINWKKSNPSGSFDEFRIHWYKNKLPKLC
jgi:hypothetical protein